MYEFLLGRFFDLRATVVVVDSDANLIPSRMRKEVDMPRN